MTDPSQYFKGRTVQEQMNEVIGYVDVRSAEVATDAIASDVAQVHQDMLDADADAAAAAASAAAAAGTLANAVKKTGEASQSIDGDIDLNDDLNVDGDATVGGDLGVTGNLGVTGTATVPTPVNNTDAATKKYVDDADALKISIADINQYAVGLTGNQTKAGELEMSTPPVVAGGHDNSYYGIKNNRLNNHTSNQSESILTIMDGTGNVRGGIGFKAYSDGKTQLIISLRNSDDSTFTSIVLGTSS